MDQPGVDATLAGIHRVDRQEKGAAICWQAWPINYQRQKNKVFPHFNKSKGGEILRRDLEATGIPYEDSSGRVADFHALRHAFISNVVSSGASPKVAQQLARHSTISLTMDTYTHVQMHGERSALDALPDLPGVDRDKSEVAKTGTDDLPNNGPECAYKKYLP